MPDFDPKAMDDAANDASLEIETIREQHPDGLTAVEDWMKKWVPSAGYKRLGKILADRWGQTRLIAEMGITCPECGPFEEEQLIQDF